MLDISPNSDKFCDQRLTAIRGRSGPAVAKLTAAEIAVINALRQSEVDQIIIACVVVKQV